jgi:hypothetical protein
MAAGLTAMAASILLACCVWLWQTSGPAEAAAPLPVWETAATQRPTDPPPSTAEEQLAIWTVQDLSRESAHDQK